MTTTTTTTTKKLTQRQIKQGLAVSHAKPKLTTPPQVIAEVHLIPLERIKIEAQVRTEFNEDSIRELAADIEARGLRQPVEVTPIGDELYKLTIGERRYRAIKLLGQKAVPAIIVKTSDKDRLVDQLAENIQREDLNLKDLAAAVRGIFDQLRSLDATAARVKKSKPWVCKHLALSCPDFGWRARNALEHGFCDDLELLGVLNQIEKALNYEKADEAFEMVKRGEMNRQQAREFLKAGKIEAEKERGEYEAKEAKREAERKSKQAAELAKIEEQTKREQEGTGGEFIVWACNNIERLVRDDNGATGFLNELRQDQRDALQEHLDQLVKANSKEKAFSFWIGQLCYSFRVRYDRNVLLSEIEQMAVIVGMQGQRPELYALTTAIEGALKK